MSLKVLRLLELPPNNFTRTNWGWRGGVTLKKNTFSIVLDSQLNPSMQEISHNKEVLFLITTEDTGSISLWGNVTYLQSASGKRRSANTQATRHKRFRVTRYSVFVHCNVTCLEKRFSACSINSLWKQSKYEEKRSIRITCLRFEVDKEKMVVGAPWMKQWTRWWLLTRGTWYQGISILEERISQCTTIFQYLFLIFYEFGRHSLYTGASANALFNSKY